MNTYIKSQLEKIEDTGSEYSKSMQINDGDGKHTHWFNIDEKTFEKIKILLLNMKE